MIARELAKQIDILPTTTSIALDGEKGVNEDTRKKMLDAVKACQYTPPVHRPKSDKDAFLVKYYKGGTLAEGSQGFIFMIIDSIEEQLHAERLGMTMTVVKTDSKSALNSIDCSKYCRMFLVVTEMMQDEFSAPDSILIPFVVVDSTIPNHCCSSVCTNNAENVYVALQYCEERGHTEPGYLDSATGAENSNERHVAFLRYVRELSFQSNPKNELRVGLIMLGVHDDFFRILNQNPVLPSCFFAGNDIIALGAAKALKEKGYKIPNNVSLVGFDDILCSPISSSTLTTIHVQRKAIGKRSVTQLMQLIEDPWFMSMEAQITGESVERSSVKYLT